MFAIVTAGVESVWMMKSADDPLTLNVPTLFVGFDVSVDSRWIVKGAVVK